MYDATYFEIGAALLQLYKSTTKMNFILMNHALPDTLSRNTPPEMITQNTTVNQATAQTSVIMKVIFFGITLALKKFHRNPQHRFFMFINSKYTSPFFLIFTYCINFLNLQGILRNYDPIGQMYVFCPLTSTFQQFARALINTKAYEPFFS